MQIKPFHRECPKSFKNSAQILTSSISLLGPRGSSSAGLDQSGAPEPWHVIGSADDVVLLRFPKGSMYVYSIYLGPKAVPIQLLEGPGIYCIATWTLWVLVRLNDSGAQKIRGEDSAGMIQIGFRVYGLGILYYPVQWRITWKKLNMKLETWGMLGFKLLLGMFLCGIPGGFVEAGASKGLES